ERVVGVLPAPGSPAALGALPSARERATAHAAGTSGLEQAGARLVVYASREAHSSVDKAVTLAGYGMNQLGHVPVSAGFALAPAALERAIVADREAGLT